MASEILKCPLCGYNTDRKYNLSRHINKVHNTEDEINEIKKLSLNTKKEIDKPSLNTLNEINETNDINEPSLNPNDFNKDDEYIYLLKEREFIKTREEIYKVGKTKQKNLKRLDSYPNGTVLILYILCQNCDNTEKKILKEFKEKFIHKRDIGLEYFKGNPDDMIEIICKIIKTNKIINNIECQKENDKKKDDNNICSKCAKIYKTKKALIGHESKCNGLHILTCPKCMNIFNSTSSKSAHIKKNKCKPRSIIHGINLTTDYINNYGFERTNYITFNDMIRIFSNNNIIKKYIEFKYFNKNFPENNNIKFEKGNGCLIKQDDEWKITDINYLTNKLIETNLKELEDYYNSHKEAIEKKDIKINIFDFNKDDLKTEIKNIIKTTMLR
jgi:uncharacterized C2H2 Zn-finger protein